MTDSESSDSTVFGGGSGIETDVSEVPDEYQEAVIQSDVRRLLRESDEEVSLRDIVSSLEHKKTHVEGALEVLTRERVVSVDECDGELVFELDAELQPEFGVERIEIGNGDRVYEVVAAKTPSGTNCIKIVEKRCWGDGYEHTVGGIILPEFVLDLFFSSINMVDEKVQYATE